MDRIQRIAVTTDFSEAARKAYPFAIQLAKKLGCRITLLHFASKKAEAYSGVSNEDHCQTVMQDLHEESQRGEFAETKISSFWPGRNVAESLPAYVKKSGCGLIVTAVRKRKGIEHFYLSDIGDEVLAVSPVPVFVFADWEQEETTEKPKVVVPFGCWDGILDTLPAVKFFDKQFNCEFQFLFVQPAAAGQQSWFRRLFKSAATKQSEIESKFSELQQSAFEEMQTSLSFCQGIPAEKISQHVAQSDADLVIVGGRAFKPRLAKRVVLQADCSVLKVPIDIDAAN